VVRNSQKNHFFGSIVSTFNPVRDNEEYQIIDGQQRLTTVSLLLLAMYNLIKQGKMVRKISVLATVSMRIIW